MKIAHLFTLPQPVFSFEFFPPKDDAAAAALMDTVRSLQSLKPGFVSVTYGAGGSTRAKTLQLVTEIKRTIGLEAMAHLTCVGHSKKEIAAILDELAKNGVANVLALRGDPPRGETQFRPHPDGYHYANELAADIMKRGQFCFGVAGYPEKHIEAPNLEVDLANLKRKADTGASFILTQLFFRNEAYFEFVNRAHALGIRIPIVPGIMPITNFTQIQRFAGLCGATLPPALVAELTPVQNDPEAVAAIGIRHAAEQCRELLSKGAPGIHFYTLNKSRATREILEHLSAFRQAPANLLRDV